MTNQILLRKITEQRTFTSDHIQLERFDWLSVALRILVSKGIKALRIARLAEILKVTQGSFYWHFSNRDDLLR